MPSVRCFDFKKALLPCGGGAFLLLTTVAGGAPQPASWWRPDGAAACMAVELGSHAAASPPHNKRTFTVYGAESTARPQANCFALVLELLHAHNPSSYYSLPSYETLWISAMDGETECGGSSGELLNECRRCKVSRPRRLAAESLRLKDRAGVDRVASWCLLYPSSETKTAVSAAERKKGLWRQLLSG